MKEKEKINRLIKNFNRTYNGIAEIVLMTKDSEYFDELNPPEKPYPFVRITDSDLIDETHALDNYLIGWAIDKEKNIDTIKLRDLPNFNGKAFSIEDEEGMLELEKGQGTDIIIRSYCLCDCIVREVLSGYLA